jgi:hypothetical protein
MGNCHRWCRITVVDPGAAVLVSWDLGGPTPAQLGAVDAIARLALLARRAGAMIRLTEVSPELRQLLDLAGLSVEWAGLPVEVEGQAEGREEPPRIQQRQEEVHPGDLPA